MIGRLRGDDHLVSGEGARGEGFIEEHGDGIVTGEEEDGDGTRGVGGDRGGGIDGFESKQFIRQDGRVQVQAFDGREMAVWTHKKDRGTVSPCSAGMKRRALVSLRCVADRASEWAPPQTGVHYRTEQRK